MTESYLPKHDDSGKLIAEMPSAELKRRLAIFRSPTGSSSDYRSQMFKRAYEAVLRERGETT